MKGGLVRRMNVASGLLALVVGTTFAVLLSSVVELRASERRARQSEEILVTANRLERLIVDLETGERGFVITGREEFLQPWQAARAALPEHASALERLVAGNPGQSGRARRIVQAATSYIEDYSIPLIDTFRRDPALARSVAVLEEGKRRVDGMREEFDGLLDTERDLAVARQRQSDRAANRAVAATAGGLAVTILLIGVFTGYLTRAIVQPIRRVAAMAGRLAAGDLGARLPERSDGEIGTLEGNFNTMAASLQASRGELAASRARIVAATDDARRHIERDLHDGTQQRLVSLVLELRATEAAVPPGSPDLREQLARVCTDLTEALDELRELSRGIHPAILSEGGLGPALKALARRSAVPVELTVEVPTRPAEPVEVAVYYVVSEALTNAVKHAHASVVQVDVKFNGTALHLSVRDDGDGGADTNRGSGLLGLIDRVHALGGELSIVSPAGKGTTLLVELPPSG